jgi:BlaI family penicillinase repressor
MKSPRPSDLELQILGVLWRSGTATARDVLNTLPDGKKRAYTTVLSTLQVMEKKGLLTRAREGLTDHWRPTVSKSRVLGPFLCALVANVFGGEPAQVMQYLLQETKVDEAELDELRQLLDAHKVQRDGGAKTKGKTL